MTSERNRNLEEQQCLKNKVLPVTTQIQIHTFRTDGNLKSKKLKKIDSNIKLV